jgi:hypothetical protein
MHKLLLLEEFVEVTCSGLCKKKCSAKIQTTIVSNLSQQNY